MKDDSGESVGFFLAIFIAALLCFAAVGTLANCTPRPQPVVPVLDGGDAGVISCAHPDDSALCACEVLRGAKCAEGEPTAAGETCEAGSKHRLGVSYAAGLELQSIACILTARTMLELRRDCEVCR